jgi:hypothetical protein
MRAAATILVCCIALSGCGGGGGSSAPAPHVAASQQSGSVVLAIPSAVPASTARSAKYISPSALSIAIAVSGGATTVADISVSSPNCTTTQTGRSCTIPLVAPAGHDTFTFTQYAGANATGAVLGTGTAALNVVAGTPFVLAATLNGTVGSIALALGTIPPAGTPGSTTLTVTAEDAAGNVIIGPGNYSSPITLTVTDSTGQTTLSSSTVTGPSSTPITVNYAGGTGTNATITASSTGIASASVSFVPGGTAACNGNNGAGLYVNDDTGGLVRYTLPVTSASVPTYLNTTYYNVWIAFDPSCNLYLTQYFTAVNKYVAPYTGAAVGSNTTNNGGDPYGVAVNAAGNVFVAYSESNEVLELSSITGTVIETIPANAPYALALDASGKLYIGESTGVGVAPPPYTGITSTLLPGEPIGGIAFDSSGDLFAGGNQYGTSFIYVLAPPYGPSNLIATITQGLSAPLGLAVDAAGNVYAPNYGNDTITAYARPYTSGPFATLPGNLPDGDAIGP